MSTSRFPHALRHALDELALHLRRCHDCCNSTDTLGYLCPVGEACLENFLILFHNSGLKPTASRGLPSLRKFKTE
jgi:hypothetical protein